VFDGDLDGVVVDNGDGVAVANLADIVVVVVVVVA
jgi:hypothetical protein